MSLSPWTWLLGVLLLGVGFGAGYVVGSGATPGGGAPLQDEAPRARTPEVAAPTPLRHESAPAASPTLSSERAAELVPLRRALEGVAPPEVPTGTGRITGVVTLKDGSPLVGVRIQATPADGGGSHRVEETEDEAVLVEAYVQQLRLRRLARREARTDGAGGYEIPDLPEGTCRVDATLEGYRIRPKGRAMVTPPAELDFVAEPVATLVLQVHLPDGSVPERAGIEVLGATGVRAGSGFRSWSPARPRIEIDPGTWTLRATAGAQNEYRSDPLPVTVEAGRPPASVRLDLLGRSVLRGAIVFPEGESGGQGQVFAVLLGPQQAPDPALLAGSPHQTNYRGRAGEETHFRFDDLPPGRYLVGATRSWQGEVVATQVVEMENRLVDVEIEMPALDPADYVAVRVLDPDGKPLEARVTSGFRGETVSVGGGSTTVARPDGLIWVLLPPNHPRDGQGVHYLDVTAGTLGTQRVEFQPGQAATVEVRFEKPGRLDVSVSGVEGTRYEGRAQVALAPRLGDDEAEAAGEGRPLVGGTATLEAQPGAYDLVLSLGMPGRGRGGEILRRAVTLRPGTQRETLAMPPLHEVTFEGLEGFAWIGPAEGGPPRFHLMIQGIADGRAVVDGIPAGEYTVRSGRKQRTFRVPAPGTVVLE